MIKNHIILETIDKLVIKFADVSPYKRIKNQNSNTWDRSELCVNGYAIVIKDLKEADRFDLEYMEWLEREPDNRGLNLLQSILLNVEGININTN